MTDIVFYLVISKFFIILSVDLSCFYFFIFFLNLIKIFLRMLSICRILQFL